MSPGCRVPKTMRREPASPQRAKAPCAAEVGPGCRHKKAVPVQWTGTAILRITSSAAPQRGAVPPRSEVDTETGADRLVATAEGAAELERGTFADLLGVAHRQRALAVLPARTDADATAFAAAVGRVDRHVHHGRAHRTLAVD